MRCAPSPRRRRQPGLSGFDPEDPTGRFIAPEHQSYPFAYERLAQLFDSPNAPDLAITPRDWCQGIQHGNPRRSPGAPVEGSLSGSPAPAFAAGRHELSSPHAP